MCQSKAMKIVARETFPLDEEGEIILIIILLKTLKSVLFSFMFSRVEPSALTAFTF